MSQDKPVVVVLDVMPEPSRAVIEARFGTDFEVRHLQPEQKLDGDLVGDATALLTMWGRVDADLIAAAPNCRVIQKLGVGVDKIDAAAAERQGITVLKAAAINAAAVAELTVLLILSVSRALVRAVTGTRAGRFEKEALRAVTWQLPGSTLGLVGFGAIGREVARRMAGFGVRIVYFDPYRADPETEAAFGVTYVGLDELVASADVVSLHVPLTPETHHLFDDDAFARAKPGMVLINTARGGLVDLDALVRAVRAGRIRGAGLDVTEQEPLPPDSPVLGVDEVVLTPHIGGAVANNFPFVIERAYSNVRAVLDGGPLPPADVVVHP
jgi:phosphoglycerate dehydrogenase-like enzyme